MSITKRALAYEAGEAKMIGQFVVDAAQTGPRPGLLVAPSFMGLSGFEIEWAEWLAGLGYAVLAVDYYGNGHLAADGAEASQLLAEMGRNRPQFAIRMQAALAALKAQAEVDPARTGAMGFCAGGKATLDLARSGADVAAAISLHGVYDAPEGGEAGSAGPVKASVLVLHGWADPLCPPSAVEALAAEFTAAGADWQLHGFGHIGHAYTNPARGPGAQPGFGYDARAAARSKALLTGFLAERLQG